MLYFQDDELLEDFEPRLFQCSNATGAFCVNEITDFVQVRNSATFYQDENKYDKSGFPRYNVWNETVTLWYSTVFRMSA